MPFTNQLQSALKAHKNEAFARQMQAYMKDLFPFLGVKAPLRKATLNELVKKEKVELSQNSRSIAKELFSLEEREFQYCAMEIASKYLKNKYHEQDIDFIRYLITTKSHWDTVDFIAKHIFGNYLLQFPELRSQYIGEFSDSNNMWLNRSAILFQLGYKAKTDQKILFTQCEKHAHSNEFFIRKAIGWALREYGKTAPEAVIDFVSKTSLKPLSQKEALKNLI